ncbi:MAG: RRXRR domain-containing protein [Thermodesulfobacteriota bacterium]|nr:RRXRR domain-containing protein [Thermodesulfobacteriota bacterium]
MFSCEIELLKGQVERNNKRRIYRRQRRSRLRYRKSRFEKQNKPEGWLAPSIQHKLDTHINNNINIIIGHPS